MSSQHHKWRYVADDPDLMRMWDGECNTLNPSEVRRSSKALAWWRCPNCGQSWQSTVAARCNSKNKERCPQCSFVLRDALKRELTGSLSDYPDLVAEWIADKNLPLVPEKVAPGSARKVWWRCPKGHEYRSKVGHRVASGVGCAQCSEPKRLAKYYENMVATKGSLASTFPEIGKEWHPTRNGELRPENFPPKSGIKVWWQCARGHHWKTAIANRTVGGTGCPYCRPQTSGLEIRVFTELQKLIPSALWREKVHAQEVDVYLPNYAIGIEVDGYPWHEHREGQDRRKAKVLSAHGIRLIRLRHEKLRCLNPDDPRFNGNSDQRALMMQLAAHLATLVDPATADMLHKYVQRGELIADEEWQRITESTARASKWHFT